MTILGFVFRTIFVTELFPASPPTT